MDSIKSILQEFSTKQVLIIGDAMIDAYMWGHINRMSPEAPVPVVEIDTRENRLGGAANVALNIQSLGASPTLFASVGDDYNATIFLELMKAQNLNVEGIQKIGKRPTTVKTRVISENKHVLRVDEEEISEIEHQALIPALSLLIENNNYDVIIFEDYNKGLLSKELIKQVISKAQKKGIPTIVDPKKNNFLTYKGVHVFKPNLKEIKEGLGVEFDASDPVKLKEIVSKLRTILNAKGVLLTLSEQGIYFQNESHEFRENAHKRHIIDVSGAGDSVVAVAALALACNLHDDQLMRFANLAGGLVCEKAGVVPITKDELLAVDLNN
jgi:rfaE bifunctional protein kinase chain/domain